ncbi:MAG: O-antigen ligase family protein [Acidobacteria bacterium]|nr:O-antigen ligase family protein [Acidobacteriota bacterium]
MRFLMSLSGFVRFKPPAFDILALFGIVATLRFLKATTLSRLITPLLSLGIFVLATWLSLSQVTGAQGWSVSYHMSAMRSAYWYASLTTFCFALWVHFAVLLTTFGFRLYTRAMSGYLMTSLVGVGFGFAVYLLDPSFADEFMYYGRPCGLFLDANVFGASLPPVLAFLTARLLAGGRSRMHRWGDLASITVLLAGLISTLSRGAAMNTCVTILVLVLLAGVEPTMQQRRLRYLATVLTLIAVIGVGCFFVYRSEWFATTARTRLGLQTYDSDRFAMHRFAFDTGVNNPLLGVGPAQFEPTFGLASHNTYLHILAEHGIFALASFGIAIVSCAYRAYCSSRTAPHRHERLAFLAIFASICGLLVNAYVIDTYHWRHLWFVLAAAWTTPSSQPRTIRTAVYQRASFVAPNCRLSANQPDGRI